ncbi:hypothetical protein AMAG_16030 [Allomyces macrogynus ATCC 38327]|uniref:Uncharacterized protein n=1 Tax=Allomyces macrogynus (strain ATCC 38327) TaxID=578462 RepID=A0A0L0TAY9_ALLM3|nr:hypothetical protein AMAG_16030 [Allomyces macrogynus ATCC 38327]|eukprot:KNE71724.1 hypothetical protein AMAG_16030 [Allomyces macrogynus ATCC 38327]
MAKSKPSRSGARPATRSANGTPTRSGSATTAKSQLHKTLALAGVTPGKSTAPTKPGSRLSSKGASPDSPVSSRPASRLSSRSRMCEEAEALDSVFTALIREHSTIVAKPAGTTTPTGSKKGISKEELRQRNLAAQAAYDEQQRVAEKTNEHLNAAVDQLADLLS